MRGMASVPDGDERAARAPSAWAPSGDIISNFLLGRPGDSRPFPEMSVRPPIRKAFPPTAVAVARRSVAVSESNRIVGAPGRGGNATLRSTHPTPGGAPGGGVISLPRFGG